MHDYLSYMHDCVGTYSRNGTLRTLGQFEKQAAKLFMIIFIIYSSDTLIVLPCMHQLTGLFVRKCTIFSSKILLKKFHIVEVHVYANKSCLIRCSIYV